MKYPKIHSPFKRDSKGRFLQEYSIPEFKMLEDMEWVWTEKIDGTNIRVIWDSDAKTLEFRGRTDRAQIPEHLLKRLGQLFSVEKFEEMYPDTSMIIYGEGYGKKIQKSGDLYAKSISNPLGVDFIAFDVMIKNVWLELDSAMMICSNLGIRFVPIFGYGTIKEAIKEVKKGIVSILATKGNKFPMEGFVMKPSVTILRKNGDRIITKLKHKDFER